MELENRREELRMIMFVHVRIDRMVDGYLEGLIASGYWAAAIDRARELKDDM